MIPLQYPSFNFRIREEDGKEWIFDELRKQWIRLTPEEWVRQNMLQYLVQVKKYPASLIAIEKEIAVGEMRKRFDILIYKESLPWMIIECKEMNVPLNDSVLKQVLNYNISLQTPYVVISNGTSVFGFALQNGRMEQIQELPTF
jgi:hypothetical protein